GAEREVRIETQVFTLRDWLLLFGAFLVSGGTYFVLGLVVWVLRPGAPLVPALLAVGMAWGIFLITAMDLYGPATFFRLHVLCETLVPPAVLHLALLFPQPHRFARWRLAGYAPALVIGALYERFLYRPAAYSRVLYTDMSYLGVAGIFFGARLLWEYWRGVSPLARQRVRVVMLGTLCGFSIPSAIVLASVVTGGGVSMNAGTFTQVLFSLSLAYAVMKHDLFELDAMVKRGAYYLVLSGAVAAAYIGAVVLLDVGLKGNAVTASPAFPVLFTLVVLLVFNPLRTRLQAFVDRAFFRTAYDGARERAALTTLGAEVALPLRLRGELVGILTAGAKRTGLFYTAGDAEFLRALAQQAAIALENARTYEALALLNARLEDRVHERTAQLEDANRELAQAYGELKSAETRLVHSEKMASLGRLVAGVAHEINNPVSFISNSVAPLTRRLQQAAASAPP